MPVRLPVIERDPVIDRSACVSYPCYMEVRRDGRLRPAAGRRRYRLGSCCISVLT